MKYLMFTVLLLTAACTSRPTFYHLTSSDWVAVGDYSQGLEGPAVDVNGDLFFVNPIHNGTIGKISSQGVFEVFVDSLPNGSVANGICFDRHGQMFLADYVNHNVLMIDPMTSQITIYAHDSTMNQPNDLAITSIGVLYASDPNWSESTGNLWRIDKGGKLTKLVSDMGTTNGIEVAPGDSVLYVNESVQRKIWKFKLSPTGEISDKQLLISFEDHGLDGMRCDKAGNLYVARYGKGTIAIVSPAGNQIGSVQLIAKKPTNIAFGGADGKTCFVTCQDRAVIEMFEASFVGNHRK